MKNWTIAKRIITGGLTLLGLLALVGAIGITALQTVEKQAIDKLQNDAIPGIVNMADITTNMLRTEIRALKAGNATTAEERDRNLERVNALTKDIMTAINAYEKTINVDADAANLTKLKELRAAYVADRNRYIDLVKAKRQLEADTLSSGDMEKSSTAYRDHALMMLTWNEDSARHATEAVIAQAHRSIIQTFIAGMVTLLVALGLGWIIIRSVNSALRQLTGTLADSAHQVAAASGQVSASSQSLAEGASEQAASLEETSSSLEELSSMTKRNADSATTAKGLSTETRQAAEAGNSDMAQMRHAMEAIKSSSNDISKIIKTIDEIAFQTNILALNAAVEAARAGEAGAGFAVVAEEVRALAQRSANSAKETAEKIEVAIRNGDQGALISEKVARALGVIVEKARKVDELVGEIAHASHEQNQGIGQINTAVSQMDKVTQSNAGNAEETAAAAEELNGQSASLRDAVGELQTLVGGTARPEISTFSTTVKKSATPPTVRSSPAPAAKSLATPNRRREPVAASSSAVDHSDFFNDA